MLSAGLLGKPLASKHNTTCHRLISSNCSMLEGVNLLVSSGTASAIAGDRLCLVKRKTARDDTKVVY